MAVSFFVNRLYVLTTENQVAYDERFHHGGNIIRGAHGAALNAFFRQYFGGDIKVHAVAGVVPIEEQNAVALMNGPAGFDNLIGRRRGENFTQRAGIDATFTDEPGKRRLMTAAAAADDNGLAGLRHRAINRAVLREGVDPSTPAYTSPSMISLRILSVLLNSFLGFCIVTPSRKVLFL